MDEEGLVWFGAWSHDTRYTPPPPTVLGYEGVV